MATKIDIAFEELQRLKLWFKLQDNKPLYMSDIPELIPLRWIFFKENWDFLVADVTDKIEAYQDPDKFRSQLEEFTDFVVTQRTAGNANSNPFSDSSIFKRFYAVWDNLEIAIAQPSRVEEDLMQSKLAGVEKFIKTDFETIRTALVAARDEIADVTGHGDVTYDTTNNRSAVQALREIKISDVLDMHQLMVGVQAVDFILANISSISTIAIDPFALAKENANNPLFEVDGHKSASMVRMRFGETLQSLAYRYLGDSDRWHEIAIANGLRSPFVDEIGSSVPLISNGDENRLNIARIMPATGEIAVNNLYVGQAVFLESTVLTKQEQRIIRDIKEVPISGELVIELSGDKDLDKLQIVDAAAIRVFKPNTINSNFFVAIPNINTPPTQIGNETPFFLSAAAEDEKIAAVDLSIDEDGDLNFTSFGDLRLSYGLENAIQAVQLKVANEAGQLARHPEFGLVSLYGTKITDPATIKSSLITSITGMIEADARFDRIESIAVDRIRTGPAGFVVQLVVRMAGAGTLVPISFNVSVS